MSGMLPGFVGHIPWFIYDLNNYQLITSPIVPGDIRDAKEVVLAEIQIPGLNYSPVFPAGNRNRKVSFQLQLVKRNNTVGNMLLLAQFDQLSSNGGDPLITGGDSQFMPPPKVLYFWGLGSAPLVWYVSKCEWVNKEGWVNGMGNPQHSTIDIELTLDEKDPLYQMEDQARRVRAQTGEITGIAGVVSAAVNLPSAMGGRPPY